MITKIIEVTNNNQNWGKFMLCRPDVEWERKALITGEPSSLPLLRTCGWGREHFWVLDLQTGEGAYFLPGGLATADLNDHRIWVCPMFEPFLKWLYAQDSAMLKDFTQLPDVVNLPDAKFAMYGYRRKGKAR